MTRPRSPRRHPQPLHCFAAALAGCLDLCFCAATPTSACADAIPPAGAAWTAVYGGDRHGNDLARASTPDGRGGVVVAGSSVTSNHQRGITTVDYDSAGTVRWQHSETVPRGVGFYDIHVALDSAGNATVVTTGREASDSGIYENRLLFVATYTPSGTRTRRLEVALPNAQQSISGLQSYDNGDFSVEGTNATADPTTNALTYYWFVARYDAAGSPLWIDNQNPAASSSDGPALSSAAIAAAVNSAGDLIVAGTVSTSTQITDQRIAVRTYDPSGHALQTTIIPEADGDFSEVTALTLDADDNVYVAGEYASPAYGYAQIEAVKLSSGGGIDWQRYFISPRHSFNANAVTVDHSGDVIVGGGLIDESGLFGYNSNAEALLVKWDASGSLLWSHGQHKAVSANTCQAVFAVAGSDEFWAVDQIAVFDPSSAYVTNKLVVDKYAAGGTLAAESYYDGSTTNLDTVVVAGGCYDPATDSLFVIGSQDDAPPDLDNPATSNYNWVTQKY